MKKTIVADFVQYLIFKPFSASLMMRRAPPSQLKLQPITAIIGLQRSTVEQVLENETTEKVMDTGVVEIRSFSTVTTTRDKQRDVDTS